MFPMSGVGFMGRFKGCPLPKNYSGLHVWYDSSDENTLYDAVSGGSIVSTNGDPIARWEDKSGNGFHLTQSSAISRPVLNVAARNGLNAVNFDGSNDFMTTGVQDIMRNIGNCYIFTVVQDTNRTGGESNHFVSVLQSGGNSRWINYTRWNNTDVFRVGTRRLPSDGFTSTTFSNNGDYNIHAARLRWEIGFADYSINERLPASGFITSTGNTSDITGELIIGGVGTSGSLPGNICELIILEDTETAGNPDASIVFLNCIFAYLQNKWDITP